MRPRRGGQGTEKMAAIEAQGRREQANGSGNNNQPADGKRREHSRRRAQHRGKGARRLVPKDLERGKGHREHRCSLGVAGFCVFYRWYVLLFHESPSSVHNAHTNRRSCHCDLGFQGRPVWVLWCARRADLGR